MSTHSSIDPELSRDEYDQKVDGIVHCYEDVYGLDVHYDDVHGLLRGNDLINEHPDSIIAYSEGNRVDTEDRSIESDEDRQAVARDILADELTDRFIQAAEQRRS